MQPLSADAVAGSADLATNSSDSARVDRRRWPRRGDPPAGDRLRDQLGKRARLPPASAPNGSVLEPASNAPHRLPSTRIGAAQVARIPLARTSRAKLPGKPS